MGKIFLYPTIKSVEISKLQQYMKKITPSQGWGPSRRRPTGIGGGAFNASAVFTFFFLKNNQF